MARWTWGVGFSAGPFCLGMVNGGKRPANRHRRTTYGSWGIPMATTAWLIVYMLPGWVAGLIFAAIAFTAVAWWVATRPLRKVVSCLKR